MATSALPTSVRGAVDDVAYSSWLGDVLETVVDLQYPLSIAQFAIMRRDPTLAAVLASYCLQIQRATWAIDGTGCRPQVVERVADDLGLPVLGVDRPGPARVRGVSWDEHIRAALLSLTYGHFGFELQAEVRDGFARLIGLWERAPWTIDEIHVDPKSGSFLGVSQSGIPSPSRNVPQIKADRMVWYTHNREGANYAGTSLLRPGYGAHLIKREIMRATATAHRRFSMGVPTVEWAPGSVPTPEQHAQAQQAASAARVGETAGLALPPGATLKLVGLSGGVPDNMALLSWLDRQLSRMALMPHIELGQGTAGGSRALGDTFVDSWTLSLQSIGSALSDQATRQIAARLVEWNEGESEPVPRITVSGIGSRRDVTAESLQLLLSSGALAADPGLESWVRREYRLPERQGMAEPKVTAPGVDLTPQPEVQAAAKPRTRASRRKTPGQPTLFGDAEDPDVQAATADTSPEAIQRQWEQAKADLLAQWPATAQPMVDELAAQAETAVAGNDLGALGTLAVSAGVLAAVALVLNGTGTALAVEAASGVVAEAAAQSVKIKAPRKPGAVRVRQTADAVAGIIASGYASGAARAALQLAGADPATVRAAVAQHLTDLGESTNGLVGENIGALLSAAQHAGRLAVLEAHPASGYRAIEKNDPNRCKPCGVADQHVYATLAEALADYPAAGNLHCLGGSRCRGYLQPVFK